MTREEQRIEEAKNRFSDDQIYPISKMYAFNEGAKWADETMIEKACEWIDDVDISKYLSCIFSGTVSISFISDDFIRDFKKAMEE